MPHLVHISVIGVDRVPLGTGCRAKLGTAERPAVVASGLPWTMLRAAQFHDLVLTMARAWPSCRSCRSPAGLRFQPVDAGEVAARLAELTLGSAAGLVPDLAGPRIYAMADLVRGYLAAAGSAGCSCRCGCPARPPGLPRRGEPCPAGGGAVTWEDFLAARLGA